MSHTFVVTGTNQGIGLEIVRQLVDRGDFVIAACRKTSEALSKLGESEFCEIVTGVDVGTDDGVANLKKAIGGRSIDVICNNAGYFQSVLVSPNLPQASLTRAKSYNQSFIS